MKNTVTARRHQPRPSWGRGTLAPGWGTDGGSVGFWLPSQEFIGTTIQAGELGVWREQWQSLGRSGAEGQGPAASDVGVAAPGLFLEARKEREGQAPLRGLGELRPLEVSRQPPDLFPGIRHRSPTRQAAAEERTRQPKDNASLGGTGRAEGQETPPRRS